MKRVWVGCSGWNYPHWREAIYPEGLPARRWLEHYATLFDTVEVNYTFYRLPPRSAVENWVEQTPPGFLFTVKASRFLTHMKRLTDMGTGLERFYEHLEPLVESSRLGPVLCSCRRGSAATTSASRSRSSGSPLGNTASSSATLAGSPRRSTPSCASMGSR